MTEISCIGAPVPETAGCQILSVEQFLLLA